MIAHTGYPYSEERMTMPLYSLQLPNDMRWPKRWLLLAVSAIALSGIAPLLLLAGRASFLAEHVAIKAFFPSVLVVHVDLSVLVWFLAIACMFWSMVSCRKPEALPYLRAATFCSFAVGALAIAIAPLHPQGIAVMNNYVPVITNPLFFTGLALIACGVLLALADLCISGNAVESRSLVDLGIIISAIITSFALAALFWARWMLPEGLSAEYFYELLFWGGGHVLQFTHVQLLLVTWMVLTAVLIPRFSVARKLAVGVLLFGVLAALISPLGFLLYPIEGSGYIRFFSDQMKYLGGVAPVLLGGVVVWSLLRSGKPAREHRALWSCVVMSLLLFGAGGMLGFLISGVNVVIPAHYHGSIVGVTLAFMGMVYYLLPQFGYGAVAQTRLAFWQPILYGGGQLLHIFGLGKAGGYGVMRKTAGALDAAQVAAELAMQVMRFGGVLAVIGGGLFVVVVIRSVMNTPIPLGEGHA